MNINIECGQRLKKCRLLSGYTQEALGNRANYKKETVCMFERGKRKLSVDAANNFAEVLHVRADYLLCRDDKYFPEEKLNLIPLIIKKLIVSIPYLIFIIMNYTRYQKTKMKLPE